MSVQRHWHHWDDTKRREWQNPDEVLNAIGLKPGDIFMDIGCGNGFFTIPAARIVGTQGKVYGIDTDGEGIEDIRNKAKEQGLVNLELIVGEAEQTVPCHDCADIVFFGNVLHDFQKPTEVIKNARKMLKPDGKLVDIDWKKTPTPIGPPLSIRFDEATAVGLITPAGFRIETIKESGKYHYMIIARPA